MEDRYYTIARPAAVEIKRKASRFIGETVAVSDLSEAEAALTAIRKREHAATHHCFAYRLGPEEPREFKYSDDGEPSGTAGRPIYDVICGHDLTDLLLVVTRYYGGTKLGTGGLVRAYGDAAGEVLEKSGRREDFLKAAIAVEIEFPLYDQLMKTIQKHEARQRKADFSDRVRLELEVNRSRVEGLKADIVQLSSGRASIDDL